MAGLTLPVFDGHNDALLRLSRLPDGAAVDAFRDDDAGHVSLEKMSRGGMQGGFFAMFALGDDVSLDFAIFDNPPYDIPLPPRLAQTVALPLIEAQARIAEDIEAAGLWSLVRHPPDLEREGPIAVLHLEGCEAIGPELEELDALFARGLRSIGPVWSRPTIFGDGVPFRYPSDGDTGAGLTDAGKRLVRRAHGLGMVVDTSHLTVKGFDEIGAEGIPLVATHSNAHALSASARNLTDRQLKDIGATGGMVGLNLGTMFLNPDGGRRAKGVLDHAVAHLAHMVEMAGEDHVGLGSDFDGAPMPEDVPDAAGLPTLVAALSAAGFGPELSRKICHGNWHRFLKSRLPERDYAARMAAGS